MIHKSVNVDAPVLVITVNQVQVFLSIWYSCGLVLSFVQRCIVCVNDSLAAEREHLYKNWLEQVCTHNNKAGGKKALHILISRIAVFLNSGALPRGPLLPSEHQ